jgi:hypothetical protein
MQQRRDEILAKKAKLEELKRQRALRAREVSATRQSIGSPVDVRTPRFTPCTFLTCAVDISDAREIRQSPGTRQPYIQLSWRQQARLNRSRRCRVSGAQREQAEQRPERRGIKQ